MNDSVRAFVDWSGEFEDLYKFNGQWPKSKEWVGLTGDEIKECFVITPDLYLPFHIYQKIEAKLKEKNT